MASRAISKGLTPQQIAAIKFTQERAGTGLCGKCGSESPIDPNVTYATCTACSKRAHQIYYARRDKERRKKRQAIHDRNRLSFSAENRICFLCGFRPWAEGRKKCTECLIKNCAAVAKCKAKKKSAADALARSRSA